MTPVAPLNLAVTPDTWADLLGRVDLRNSVVGMDNRVAEAGATGGSAAVSPTSGSFSNVLGQFVQGVNDKQVAAGEAVRGMLSGQDVSLHQAMIAMEEASVSFQLMVEVRNKLLESYQELMRMQV